MKLATLADVRELLEHHLPAHCRERSTWRHVSKALHAAAAGAGTIDVAVALRLVLELERVPCQPIKKAGPARASSEETPKEGDGGRRFNPTGI